MSGRSSRLLLVAAVGLLLVGGVVGTAAVGVGPVADILDDEEDRAEFGLESADTKVFVEPGASPEGDAYAELTGDEQIEVDIEGLSAQSLTQIDDLLRVGFGSDRGGDGGSDIEDPAFIGFNATGTVDDDPDADVLFVDMETGETIADNQDDLEDEGLELEFGDRADVGIIAESGTSESLTTEVTVFVKEPGVSDFQLTIELEIEEDEPVADNEVLETNNVTTLYEVINEGDREDTQAVTFAVDGDQKDQRAVALDPNESAEDEFVYQTTEDDVPEGEDEDPIELRVATDDSTVTEDVLVMDEIHRYTDPDTRVVGVFDLSDAITDWRNGEISVFLLSDVIDAWRDGGEVAPSGELIGD